MKSPAATATAPIAGRCDTVRRSPAGRPVVTVALLAALVLACEVASTRPADDPDVDGYATIAGRRVALELAVTGEEQRLGLGERDALPWDRGMLFLYETPAFHRFWMRGMRFDIDIVWIRGDRIVDISHRVPHVPGGDGPTVAPRQLADKVLEVNAGYAATHGWRPGQRVAIELDRAGPTARAPAARTGGSPPP